MPRAVLSDIQTARKPSSFQSSRQSALNPSPLPVAAFIEASSSKGVAWKRVCRVETGVASRAINHRPKRTAERFDCDRPFGRGAAVHIQSNPFAFQ